MLKRMLIALVVCLLLLSTACGTGSVNDPASSDPNPPAEPTPPASTVQFSAKPSIYFFGDEHVGADAFTGFLGSGLANYMSYYVYQLFDGQNVTCEHLGLNGANLQRIKMQVSSNLRSTSVDVAVLMLSDRDALNDVKNNKTDGVEKYKQTLTELLAEMDGKARHILVVGPFTTSEDAAFRTTFAAYQAAAQEVCQAVQAVQYFACQNWLDEWAQDGPIVQDLATYSVLSRDTSMKLMAKIVQETHMNSLNTTPKNQDTKSFNSDFVITFAGDSITDNARDREISKDMFLGQGYPAAFKAYLMAEYGIDNIPTVYNVANSGATSSALMSTYLTDVENYKPNYLIVMVGINDAYTEWMGSNLCSAEKYKANMDRMMANYAKKYDKVLLVSPYYLEKPEDVNSNRVKYVNNYIAALQEVAGKYDNAVFVDVQSAFDKVFDKIGYTKMSLISPDKCHLTTQGNWVMFNEIIKALQV